ncbi:hypothetical protein I4J31_03935 [Corynebacterium belfantii]|uniref:hypothetical protein n=1 Tax=Corynebacterium belfantii TaxID=2014537 RepID=UPI0018D48454|nr:hypothetical protein [Corynebacterium belfantii]MBG9309872.1 hypothetical protein [Corynebacterium belfantii]
MSNGYGTPIDKAYEINDAIHVHCPECNAADGEYCENQKGVKKIPHASRLGIAYRDNNPEGRRKHQQRQAHLAHHRKTYTSPWQRHTAF